MKTLIKNANVLLPDGTTPIANICIDGSQIIHIGNVPEDFRPGHIIDGRDMLATPGFVNAHTHASMTLLRSYADDMELMDWLNKMIWPAEAKMNREDIYWGAMLAALEMIQTGTTAFADMYGPWMDTVAEVVADSGLRGVLSRGLIGVAPDADKKLAEGVAFYRDFHGAANDRIHVMLSPHAPFTCPPDYMRKVAAAAQKDGIKIHIHMHETKTEIADSLKTYGKRPFAWVSETGLFDGGATVAAHCVHMDDEDIAIMKKYDIRAVHNPGSNMKLASGVAPVSRMLAEGICVALGTDGASSNNNMDMLEETALAALLHKVDSYDSLAIPAATSLKMATEYGANALSLTNVGRLEMGAKADIVLFSMKGTKWTPRNNLVSLLIYSANSSSVDTVLVDGTVLMEHRELKTLDEERILFEAQRSAERLIKA